MSDQINTENVVEEVKNVVTETVPETAPVVENTEAVEEVVNEVVEEKKTKSFFDIFKKKKPEEEAVEAHPTEEAKDDVEADAAPAADAEPTEAPAEEVPVETAPAKKTSLCGLCGLGKKEEAPAPSTKEAAPATEEAAPATEEAAPVAEETAPATEEAAPVAEEASPAAEEAPIAAAAATEEVADSTEGEAVAPVVEADVARAGILHKSGKFFKTNMNERHSRLLSNGVFQYSKTEDFTKAHECKIDGETTTVAFMAEGEDAPHKYRFELHCCGTVSTYAADTEEDRDEWIRAIETVKESVAPAAAAETAETAEVAPEAVEETPAAASD